MKDGSSITKGTTANSIILNTEDIIIEVDSFRFACDMYNIVLWAVDHKNQCYGAGGLSKMIKDYYREDISEVELDVIKFFYSEGNMPVSPDEIRYYVINKYLLKNTVDSVSL